MISSPLLDKVGDQQTGKPQLLPRLLLLMLAKLVTESMPSSSHTDARSSWVWWGTASHWVL